MVFMTDLWDKGGIKLWDSATKGNKAAAEMLPSLWVIFEVLKAQEKSQAKGNACPPSMAEAQCSLKS